MKGNIIWLLVGILALSLVAACDSPSTGKQFEDTGLFGQHPLHRVERTQSLVGSISGSFFLGIGGVNGSLNTDRNLQFYWSPKPGEIVATSLPYRKFRFIVDESKDIPTVEFVFTDYWLNSSMTYWREKDKMDLNEFLMSKNAPLVIAVIRISKKTMEKEVYLPK